MKSHRSLGLVCMEDCYLYISLVYVVMSWRKSLSWLGCICTVCMYNELADKEANKIKSHGSLGLVRMEDRYFIPCEKWSLPPFKRAHIILTAYYWSNPCFEKVRSDVIPSPKPPFRYDVICICIWTVILYFARNGLFPPSKGLRSVPRLPRKKENFRGSMGR